MDNAVQLDRAATWNELCYAMSFSSHGTLEFGAEFAAEEQSWSALPTKAQVAQSN